MKKTMLTYKTLDRFEREYKTDHYTPEQIETIEHAAYVANMNQCNNPDWTESDIFADFIRVLGIHKIETETNEEEETMENANNVIESIQNAAQKVAADRAAYIAAHTMTAAEARNTAFVRECSTPKQWERIAAMRDAEPIAAADIDKLTAKAVKRVQKSAQDATETAQRCAAMDAPEHIRLYITWTRSAVWGWNPHCNLTAWSHGENGYTDSTTHGSASGCGYDKTSAACAQALNASEMVRGALVRFVNDGGSNYGVYTADTLNYPACPYFEGGCGMSTITDTLRKMGYKVTDTTHYNRRGSEECRIIEASREV